MLVVVVVLGEQEGRSAERLEVFGGEDLGGRDHVGAEGEQAAVVVIGRAAVAAAARRDRPCRGPAASSSSSARAARAAATTSSSPARAPHGRDPRHCRRRVARASAERGKRGGSGPWRQLLDRKLSQRRREASERRRQGAHVPGSLLAQLEAAQGDGGRRGGGCWR